MTVLSKEMKVKDWYCSTYPTDTEGKRIKSDVTFASLNRKKKSIDGALGVTDSIISSRVQNALNYLYR